MKKSLAIFTPLLGKASESFVTRHATELLPGRTVVVCLHRAPDAPSVLDGIPTLALDQVPEVSKRGLFRRSVNRRDLIIEFLAKHRVSAVLCEYLDFAVQYRRLVQNQGIRFVAHSHGYDVSQRECLEQWGQRYPELNEAEAVIAVSQYTRSRLGALGIREEKLRVVPCGVDLPPLQRIESESICSILAVGRLVAKKAPLLLVRAFRALAERHPNLHLDLVGEGPLEAQLLDCVRELGLESQVRLHGAVPHAEVLRMMNRADLFLQHSVKDPESGDEEGLPVAIMEAMAHALPVISTEHAGIPELVLPGRTGLLVAEGDVAGMSAAMEQIIQHPEDAKAWGREGREHIRAHYLWKDARNALLDALFPEQGTGG